ncbi:unnamed protein product [Urochloa humidicola]
MSKLNNVEQGVSSGHPSKLKEKVKDKEIDSGGEAAKGDKKVKDVEFSKTVVLKMQLHCEACITNMKWCLYKIRGVKDVAVDKKEDIVLVTGVTDTENLPKCFQSRLNQPVQMLVPDASVEKMKNKEKEPAVGYVLLADASMLHMSQRYIPVPYTNAYYGAPAPNPIITTLAPTLTTANREPRLVGAVCFSVQHNRQRATTTQNKHVYITRATHRDIGSVM